MVRVLQVLATDADFTASRLAETIGRDAGKDLSVARRTIGRGGDWRSVPFAVAGTRRLAPDLIHAFDATSLAAAALAGSQPIIFSPSVFDSKQTAAWLRAILNYRDLRLVCASATQRDQWTRRGLPPERVRLIRPGVEFGRLRRRRDPELRAALGFRETDQVMLAVGESTRAARHDHALWAVSILHFRDPTQRLLLWGRGPHLDSTARFGRRFEQPDLFCIAEQRLGRRVEWEELPAVADAAIVAADGPVTPLPIAICMAAGVPIVSTVTPIASELLEDRHTALMVAPGSPRALAQRLLDLQSDASLRWAIADRARSEAYEYFSHARFMEEWRETYAAVGKR
jgi:glycosyltransferase involved in cell wall biosynthesis